MKLQVGGKEGEVKSRIATALTVAVVSAAWTVTATAGNPHGAPPGQQKASDSTAATASTSTSVAAQSPVKAGVAVSAGAKRNARAAAHAKANGRAASPTAQASASTTTTAQVQTGVKPSSVTSHNTVAPASSNQTKLYGNGQTAGQIATRAGFGSANLYGPGNSQPHKVVCGPHNVDVHALKAHAAACTAAAAAAVAASVSPAASAQTSVASSVAGQGVSGASGSVQAAGASAPTKQSPRGGGVLGARAELASATKPLKQAVLATVRKGTLPFTGLGLWFPVALGLALIAAGYELRQKGSSFS
jgi:hypothetical protein